MTQATNSLGFEVQAYSAQTGWKPFLGPFPDPDTAQAEMVKAGLLGSGHFRVYETLDHPATQRKD